MRSITTTCLLSVSLCLALSAQDPARDIKNKDPLTRIKAIDALSKPGTDGAKLLIRALKDKDWEVRESAAIALGVLKSPAAFKPLVDLCLKGPVYRMRRAAAVSLMAIDADAAVAALLKKMSGKTAVRAGHALALVIRAQDSEVSVKKLKKLLKDKNPLVREAADLVMWAGDKDRVGKLRKMLKSNIIGASAVLDLVSVSPREDDLELVTTVMMGPGMRDVLERRARQSTAAVLAVQKDSKSAAEKLFETMGTDALMQLRISKLVPLLTRNSVLDQAVATSHVVPCQKSGDADTRSAAARSLREIGGEEAAKACADQFENEREPRVRYQLLDTVVAIRGLEKPVLVSWVADRLAEDSNDAVRERAAVHLGKPDLKGSHSALVHALDDSSWHVAICAAVSLGKSRNVDAAPILAKLATNADWKRRGAAVVALMHLNRKESIEPLIAAVSDKTPAVARAAHEGLRRISSRKDIAQSKDAWKAWWASEGTNYIFRDWNQMDENLRKYGYSVPDRQIYEGLDIVVLKSRGDHIEELLDRLKIEHRDTQAAKVSDSALHPEAVCVVNCTGEIESNDVEPLEWFVRAGGSLFGSCWALHETIERISPGVIRKFDVRGHEVLDNVRAYPCDITSSLVTGVFPAGVVPIYHLEGAHLIEVLDAERAEVLIDSPDASSRHGSGNLAAWFEAGHGVILDSVNHFDLQGLEVATGLKTPEQRQIYAIDHMGMSYAKWREGRKAKYWSSSPRASREVPDLSAFRFITNFVRAKRMGIQSGK